jgi:acyl-CoA thioesterase
VNAALGQRPFGLSGQWEQFPAGVPRPDECRPRPPRLPVDGTIHSRTEQRLVKARDMEELDGTRGDGRSMLWARIPEVLDGVDATALAVMGDFMPMGVGQALGILGGGTSLDNTLRVVHLVPTEWVLCDIQVHAVERGFGHGLVHLYAEDGTLLAIGSQSCIVRYWKDRDGQRLTATPAGERSEA